MTTDDTLLIELGPLLGDRYRTHLSEDPATLEQASLTSALLLLDASTLPDARALLQRLGVRHPQLPVVLVCADGETTSWQALPGVPGLCAVLERNHLHPTAMARALGEAEQRLDAAGTVATSNALPRLDETTPARKLPWPAIAAAAVVVLAALGWFLLRPHGTATAPVAAQRPAGASVAAAPNTGPADAPNPAVAGSGPSGAQPAATPAPAPRSTLELLSDARVAFRDERLQLPRVDGAPQGDSALELYQRVLLQDPQNDEARDGLRRLLAVTRDRIQSDLASGKLDEAARLLGAYRDSGVASDDITRLAAEVNAARPRLLMQQARAALAAGDVTAAGNLATQLSTGAVDSPQLAALKRDIAAHSADQALAQQAAQVRAAISAGALLEPAGESAKARLQAMQQGARGNPLTLAVTRELQSALLARAQQAIKVNDAPQAQSWLAAAGEYGASPELASVQAELHSAQEQVAQRSAAAESARTAATSVPAARTWFAAKPLKPLEAAYPPDAARRGLSGYVIVEFILSADGRARDAHVVEASPPAVFDAAALAAVNGGRFSLAMDPGQSAVDQRGRLRIGFKPGETARPGQRP